MNLTPSWRRWTPSRRGETMNNWMERLFDEPFQFEHLPEAFQKGAQAHLPMNVSENERTFTVALEVPGMDEKDINIEVMGNQLVISGEKRFEQEKKEREWHRVEVQYGSFSRSITLPANLKTDSIEAVYKKGVLTLTIPKREPTPASKVKIRSE